MPAGLLLAAFWPRLLTTLDASELVLLLIAVGVVTLLTPITRDVASRLLDRYVYRTQANYQRTVREASQMLTRVLHLKALLGFITTTVVRSTAAEGVVLYLREEQECFGCAISERGRAVGTSTPYPKCPPKSSLLSMRRRSQFLPTRLHATGSTILLRFHDRLSAPTGR